MLKPRIFITSVFLLLALLPLQFAQDTPTTAKSRTQSDKRPFQVS